MIIKLQIKGFNALDKILNTLKNVFACDTLGQVESTFKIKRNKKALKTIIKN